MVKSFLKISSLIIPIFCASEFSRDIFLKCSYFDGFNFDIISCENTKRNSISERKPTFCACSFAEIICTLLVHHQTCFCLKNNTLRVSFWPYYTSYKNPFATKFADHPSLMLHSWNTQTLFGTTFISQYFSSLESFGPRII